MIKTKILIGLDLGQQNDSTVISVLDITHQNVTNAGFLYKLIYLYKFKLKTSYTEMIVKITNFIEHTFNPNEYILIVDYTGVGRPIVDMLREKELKVVALNITSGTKSMWRFGNEVSVPKKEIVSSLQVVIQGKKLLVSKGLGAALLQDYIKEFLNFEISINKNANVKAEAGAGNHDDIVMSIGLATWYGEYASRKTSRRRIISGS